MKTTPSTHQPTGDKRFAADHPLNILIAEDNYINRRLLVLLLTSLGYQPDARENGRDCLEAVLHHSYDLLLTDVDMPEMSGIDCAYRVREAGLELPIIAVSASEPVFTREQCIAAGMNDYMRKPVILSDLQRVLREVSLRKWVHNSNLAVVHA